MDVKRILEELEFIESSAAKDNYIAGAIHNHATNIRNFLLEQEKDITNALIVASDRMETILKIEKNSKEESTINLIEELKNKSVKNIRDYISSDDIEFLKKLSHERNTQEKDGCADPVFWMIYDKKNIYCEDGEYFEVFADGEVVYSSFNKFTEENLEEFKNHIIENVDLSNDDKEELKDIKDNYDLLEFINTNDLGLNIARFNREFFISANTGPFLTKKAAKKHIAENYYHYSKDVTTYGMVGWRNPEFKQLMNIVSKIERMR